MPKIPPSILNAVFYLFETAEDAKDGKNPGGTGFIVGWNKGRSLGGPYHFYAVTNWHVAVDESDADSPPYPVIRLNNKSGTTEIIDLRAKDWKFIPYGPDIAVVPIEIDPKILSWSYVPTDMFVQPEDIWGQEIAVGDDVFMIGLFVDHHGDAVNAPSSRFGNISVLPTSLSMIRQPTGLEAAAYVVDMHSRSGFSGSPVFMYRTPGQDLTMPLEMQFRIEIAGSRLQRGPLRGEQVRIIGDTIFKFLGIHFGQFEEEWELGVPTENRAEIRKRALIKDEARVRGWSGMTTVIPAWEIINVLENIPELVATRDEEDAKRQKRTKEKRSVRREGA